MVTRFDHRPRSLGLELGGKSPNIVFPDAYDLDAAAGMAAWGIFFNSGGTKLSGRGRDKSVHALDKFTDLKTTSLAFPQIPLPGRLALFRCTPT